MRNVSQKKALRKRADRVFSLYIRLKYASKNGYVRCYTCGAVLKVKEMTCGHFYPRGKLGTRYNEDNCRPQCDFCNCFCGGKEEVFQLRLKEEGVNLKELRRLAHSLEPIDYQTIVDKCRKKIKDLS